MFVLRKISAEGIQLNFSLGSSYTLVRKDENPKEFERQLGNCPHPENTYGIIHGENAQPHYLYANHHNFIMASDGKTFANVTLK
jgi:hypothetical protein